MDYSVKEAIISSATQFVLLLDSVPVYYPNLYISREHRKRSPNTQKAILNHLTVFLEFLKYEEVKFDKDSLEKRLSLRPKPKYLEDGELSRFFALVHWSKKEVLDKKFAGIALHPNAYTAIGQETALKRCEVARDYIAFLYDQLGDDSSKEEAAAELKRRMKRKIKAVKPAWKRTKIEDFKGLTEEQRTLLYDKLAPDHPENPFRSEAVRYRNYIMILLGLELGLRISEMLLIKLGDINYDRCTIDVVRPPSGLDQRKPAPSLKTHERRLPASPLLLSFIQTYQREYRSLTQARKHPFLLVAHGRNKGAAFGLDGAADVFDTLSNTFPELSDLTAHVLRHDSVYTLLSQMTTELKGLSVEDRTQQVQKILTYAFGWKSTSDMPELYGAKFWHEQASEFFTQRQERFSGRFDGLAGFGTQSVTKEDA
ncbi:MAG: site-specific integrase [Motiliproteus sp.]|nr:site-specific integrase [Motiliproteus sp.]MCW9052611.1 site-specific integrase [Motiliproteus sp.]